MKALDTVKKFFDETAKPTARVVGKDLVVSFPNAVKPCVWKTDLEVIKSAIFEVDVENAMYQLVMKDGQTKKEVITVYEDREDAVDALNIISKAMLYSNTKKGDEVTGGEEPLGFFKSFIIFLAFFFIVLFIAGLFVSPSEETDGASQEVQVEKVEENAPAEATQQQKGKAPEGVPLSADDLLGGSQ